LKSSSGFRRERRILADGTVHEYRYQRKKRAAKADRTVASVIAAWQNSPEWEALRPATVDSYTRYIHPLFQAFRLVDFRKLKREHLMGVRNSVAKMRGHGAAIGYCRAVSALFKWAIEQGIAESSPALKMRNKLRQGELPTWTEEQARRAMSELPEPYRRAVVLAYYTGQRRGDLCRLRWSDYDGSAFHFIQQKPRAKVEMEIPVVPGLRTELDAWKADRRAVTILETVRGLPWLPVYLSRTLPAELAKIGLPGGLNIHGLRKLTAVRLAEAGCSAHEIAAITGHKTLAMVQHYTKAVNQRTLADVAVLRLDKVPNGTKRQDFVRKSKG
jgi:integrase